MCETAAMALATTASASKTPKDIDQTCLLRGFETILKNFSEL